jgi:hypothetical protein
MWGKLVLTRDVDAYLRDAKPETPGRAAAASGDHKHHAKN